MPLLASPTILVCVVVKQKQTKKKLPFLSEGWTKICTSEDLGLGTIAIIV